MGAIKLTGTKALLPQWSVTVHWDFDKLGVVDQ